MTSILANLLTIMMVVVAVNTIRKKMKNYLYIATITAIILASVGIVTAYPTTNQDASPSFILKTKIAKDSIYKEVFDHSGFNALLQKNVAQKGRLTTKRLKKIGLYCACTCMHLAEKHLQRIGANRKN